MAGAIEIKDHNSQVRMSLSAFGEVFVRTINPISVQGTVNTIPTLSPDIDGIYLFSIGDVPGTVAANNFLTLMNPSGSGKVIAITGAYISSYQVADASTSVVSMRGYRIPSSTGGVLVASSAVAKFQSSYPDSVAEIRTGNPTATPGAAIFSSPPPVGAAKGSSGSVHQIIIPDSGSRFTLVPGEGVAFRAEVGDVDQRWNVSVSWVDI